MFESEDFLILLADEYFFFIDHALLIFKSEDLDFWQLKLVGRLSLGLSHWEKLAFWLEKVLIFLNSYIKFFVEFFNRLLELVEPVVELWQFLFAFQDQLVNIFE